MSRVSTSSTGGSVTLQGVLGNQLVVNSDGSINVSGTGVTSLNTMVGALTIAPGSGVTVTPTSGTLTIASTSPTPVETVTATSPVVSSGGQNPNISITTIPIADGGTPGFVRVTAKSAGTSFTITSSSSSDTSTIAWLIIEGL